MFKYQIKKQKSLLSSPYKIGAHVPTTRSSFTYFYVVTQCTHSTFLRERNIIFWEGSVCVCMCVKERERERQGQIPQSLIIIGNTHSQATSRTNQSFFLRIFFSQHLLEFFKWTEFGKKKSYSIILPQTSFLGKNTSNFIFHSFNAFFFQSPTPGY